MRSKGISPLIAAVLLIAFTISVGGIFAEWSGALTTSATQDNSEAQQQILDCTSMNIEIVDINEDYNSNNLDVTLRSNNGAVGNVSVRAFPSLAVDYTEMTSAGQIDVVSLNVSDQQDSIQAASQNCNIEVSENLVR
jgi:flagellin-like protein